MPTQSENYPKLVFSSLPQLCNVKIVQISPSRHHILPNGNSWKAILSRPTHAPKVDTVEKSVLFKKFFEDHHPLKEDFQNQSVQDHQPHPLNAGTVKNQCFQDNHIFLKWKFSKISPFKTIKSSLSRNYLKPVLFKTHTLPKRKLSKISPYKTTTSPKSRICKK